ncbi:MAG: hypothetical protein AAF442_05270 [Pseudomonadota bacterium]
MTRLALIIPVLILAACTSVDIATYTPPGAIKSNEYAAHLDECRKIATDVEIAYKEIRKQEMMVTAIFGLVGGAVGGAVGDSGGSELSKATIGFGIGSTIGHIVAEDNATNWIYIRRHFYADGVIIQCMENRGHNVPGKTARLLAKERLKPGSPLYKPS